MNTKLKIPQENNNGWHVPIEILKHLFSKNRISLLPLYLFATRHNDFQGHLHVSKIPQIAKLIERTPASVVRKLFQLAELGLCHREGNVWMFTGGDIFTARAGKTKVKTVEVKSFDRSYLTTLAYATLITEQARRKARKTKQLSDKREKLQNDISCSYTSAWIGKAVPTISKRRKQAKGLGMLDYQRSFKTKLIGGQKVQQVFNHALHTGNTKGSDLLFQSGEKFAWMKERPATFTGVLPFFVHSIPLRMKSIARQQYKKR